MRLMALHRACHAFCVHGDPCIIEVSMLLYWNTFAEEQDSPLLAAQFSLTF